MAFELFPVVQWFDNSGLPLSGGLISTFIAGTTTPQATFTDSTGLTPQANPVVLDSAGRAQIWFAAASYKLVLKTAAGATLMTIDNVTLDNLAAVISSLTMTGNLTMQQSTAATAGANQSSNTYSLQGTYWNGAASAIDQWQLQNVLGAGTNPTSTLTVTHSGSSGSAVFSIPAANISFGGNMTLTGTLGVVGAVTNTSTTALNGDTTIATGKVLKFGTDTGLSRDSAGVVDVGNGTQGDRTGSLRLTKVNKITVTEPATGSTLTIADGKTLTANNSLTLAGTDGTTQTFQASDTIVGQSTTDTLKNKTLQGASSGNAVTLIDIQDPGGAVTNNGSDQTIYTKTLLAGQIAAGKSINVRWGVLSSNAVAVTYKLILGTTTIQTFTSGAAIENVQTDIDISNNVGVQNIQHVRYITYEANTIPQNGITASAATENTANSLVLKLVTNAASGTVTGKFWKVTLDQ